MGEQSRAVRELARKVYALERQAQVPQLPHSSLDDAGVPEFDADGQLSSVWGRQHDGTHGAYAYNGPVPPTPTDPVVMATPGTLRVRWDGGFTGDGGPDPDVHEPMDLAAIEVHIAALPAFVPTAATRVGPVTAGGSGEITVTVPAGQWWVRLRSRSSPGIYSPPSTAVDVLVDDAVTQEQITRLQLGKTGVWYGLDEPTEAAEGDLWFDGPLPLGPFLPKRWDGEDWQPAALADGAVAELAVGRLLSGTLGLGVSMTVPATDTDEVVIGRPAEGLAYTVPGLETEDGAADEPRVAVFQLGRFMAVIDRATGETLAMIDRDGSLTAGDSSLASLSVGGDDIGALLDQRGGFEVTAAYPNDQVGPYIGEFGYIKVQFEARAGRSYRIDATSDVRGSGGAVQYLVRFRRVQAVGTDPVAPTMNSTILGRDNTGDLSGSIIETVAHTARYYTPEDRTVVVLLTGAGLGSGDTALTFIGADVVVTDTGPAAPRTGAYSRGGGGIEPSDGSSAPPPDDAPPPTTRSPERFMAWQATYSQYGRSPARYGLRQGQGGSSRYMGVLGIPDQVRSDLDGVPASAIDFIDVRLSYAEPAVERRARIGVSGQSGPGTLTPTTQVVSEDFRPGQTRWVRLPRSTYAGIADRSVKAITLGDTTASGQDLMNFYQLTASSSLRPKIRYRYTK